MKVEQIENGVKVTIDEKEKNIFALVNESKNILQDTQKITFMATGNDEGHISELSKSELLIILFKLLENRKIISINIKYEKSTNN